MAKTGKCFLCSDPSNGMAGGSLERCPKCIKRRESKATRKWRAKNKARVSAHQKAWRDKNKAYVLEASKAWRKKNPEAAKAVRRRDVLKRQYGLTPEQFEGMRSAQDGRCAICDQGQTNGSELCVDHDHETGAVRGLLCHDCNVALGRFKDDTARILAAERYLQSHRRLKLLHA